MKCQHGEDTEVRPIEGGWVQHYGTGVCPCGIGKVGSPYLVGTPGDGRAEEAKARGETHDGLPDVPRCPEVGCKKSLMYRRDGQGRLIELFPGCSDHFRPSGFNGGGS